MKILIQNLRRKSGAVLVDHPNLKILTQYLIIIAILEMFGTYQNPLIGLVGHAILLLVLINHSLFTKSPDFAQLFTALALHPLLRILSLTTPIQQIPTLYWPILAGLPLLFGIYAAARFTNLLPKLISFKLRNIKAQLAVALIGIPFGLIIYLLVRPQPIISDFSWWRVILGGLILFVFAALPEELIFRGILLELIGQGNRLIGLIYSSTLYFLMALGSGSLIFAIIMGSIGIFFAWCVQRNQSMWEVIIAHGFMLIGTWIIWPLLLG